MTTPFRYARVDLERAVEVLASGVTVALSDTADIDFDLAVHVLFDDLEVLPDPHGLAGSLVDPVEASALADLGRRLSPLLDRLGDVPFSTYASSSEWSGVAEAARAACSVMLPGASRQHPVTGVLATHTCTSGHRFEAGALPESVYGRVLTVGRRPESEAVLDLLDSHTAVVFEQFGSIVRRLAVERAPDLVDHELADLVHRVASVFLDSGDRSIGPSLCPICGEPSASWEITDRPVSLPVATHREWDELGPEERSGAIARALDEQRLVAFTDALRLLEAVEQGVVDAERLCDAFALGDEDVEHRLDMLEGRGLLARSGSLAVTPRGERTLSNRRRNRA